MPLTFFFSLDVMLQEQNLNQSMEGWQDYVENGIPLWNINSQKGISLYASVEPSGLVLEYTESDPKVENWIASFISKATLAFG